MERLRSVFRPQHDDTAAASSDAVGTYSGLLSEMLPNSPLRGNMLFPSHPRQDTEGFFPTFPGGTIYNALYLNFSSTRLGDGEEGLMVDTGAYDNLCGSEWADRVAVILNQYNLKVLTSPLERAVTVEGVGKVASVARTLGKFPGALKDKDGVVRRVLFESPIVPQSGIPALWGRRSLAAHRAVIDIISNTIVLCGPGDWQGGPPPGSWVLPLKLSMSGHLFVPCTCFEEHRHQHNTVESVTGQREAVRVFHFNATSAPTTITTSSMIRPRSFTDQHDNSRNEVVVLAKGVSSSTQTVVRFALDYDDSDDDAARRRKKLLAGKSGDSN